MVNPYYNLTNFVQEFYPEVYGEYQIFLKEIKKLRNQDYRKKYKANQQKKKEDLLVKVVSKVIRTEEDEDN